MNLRPVNKKELFNLRHAQARNVIERIFGVLKKRWQILNQAAQYDMAVQAQIPPGLGAVHNFILDHDDDDLRHYLDQLGDNDNVDVDPSNFGEPGQGAISREERERASLLRDEIATRMWEQYQQYLRDHTDILNNEFVPNQD
jgi:hypothetical protein